MNLACLAVHRSTWRRRWQCSLRSLRAEVDLASYTDALSVKQSAERSLVMDWLAGALTGVNAITQRSRVLTAARPVLNMIRAVLTAKRLRGRRCAASTCIFPFRGPGVPG